MIKQKVFEMGSMYTVTQSPSETEQEQRKQKKFVETMMSSLLVSFISLHYIFKIFIIF